MDWIKIEDRLPEFEVDVLVFHKFNPEREDGVVFYYQSISQLIEVKQTKNENSVYFNCVDGVTHWMPLPEPPK